MCDGEDRNCDGDPLSGLTDSDGDGLVNCEDPEVYTMDFDSGWGTWSWVDLGGGNGPNWYASGGTLSEGSNAADSIAYSEDLGALDTWTITVDVYNTEGANNDSGIAFGLVDEDNYYLAAWSDPTGYYGTAGDIRLEQCVSGTCSTLATADGSMDLTQSGDGWATLAVTVDFDDITVTWNGSEIFTYTDTDAAPIGLESIGLYTLDNDGTVTYDNVVVTNP